MRARVEKMDVLGWNKSWTVCIICSCVCQRGPTQGWLTRRILVPYVYWCLSWLDSIHRFFIYLQNVFQTPRPLAKPLEPFSIPEGSYRKSLLLWSGCSFSQLLSGGHLWDLLVPKVSLFSSGNEIIGGTAPHLQVISWEVFSLPFCFVVQRQRESLGLFSLLSN